MLERGKKVYFSEQLGKLVKGDSLGSELVGRVVPGELLVEDAINEWGHL